MPASLNLTPVSPGSLTLEPFAVVGAVSYLLQETTDKILLEDGSGFLILEEGGTGLSLTPISPGSLTLTPIT